jgi:NAD(P)-dependent dehydrogenase (short-subunit alcohol dehydrogenase family)
LSQQELHELFDLSGKIALVTGSVAGLGKAVAVALARQGDPTNICKPRNRNFQASDWTLTQPALTLATLTLR